MQGRDPFLSICMIRKLESCTESELKARLNELRTIQAVSQSLGQRPTSHWLILLSEMKASKENFHKLSPLHLETAPTCSACPFRHCKGADHSLELLLPNAPWVSSLSLSSGHCFSHQPIVWYPLFWLSAGSLSCVLPSVVCYTSLFLFAADHQGVLTFTVSLLSAILVHNHAGFYPDHLFHGNGPLKVPSGPHVVQTIPCTTAALRTALQAPPCTLVYDLCWSSLCLERLDRIPNS